MAENQNENFSQYCSMHDHVISTKCEIKKGFKWLIGLLIGELMAIIAVLSGIIGVLISNGLNEMRILWGRNSSIVYHQ